MSKTTALLAAVLLGLVGLVACMPAAAPTPTAVPPTAAATAVPTNTAEPTKPPTAVPPTPTPVPTKAPEPPKADANTLVALKVTTAPKSSALADDAAWANAPALKVAASGGQNFKGGATEATLKAVYTADTVYFLLQYDDPTLSVRRSPFVKQPDGTWKKLADPDDKGGDNNKYYEDKFALIWNIGGSIKNFDSVGCFAVCHAGEPNKAFGNKYTETPGETGDIWHWKSVRTGTVGQVDDQFLDDTRWDKDKAPEAGRKSDAKTAGGYADIALKDGKPEFMSKDAKPANAGGTYWLLESDKVAFDDSKFKPGDEVASIMVAPFTGDRGDISAASAWKDGKYTVVFSRKLVTGSKTDVQFDKLDGTYTFGLAMFDNAQVRHAYNTGALKMIFGGTTASVPSGTAGSTLLAAKAATAPKLDGVADDAAWASATALKVSAAGGVNFSNGATEATLKAVYTADSIYFLLEYNDPTLSVRRSPFVKQPDGTWKKLVDPDDKGGDNNKYYEDKFALIWSINNSIKGFDTTGCFVVCHAGEPNKAFGNKYTAAPGETGDIWHWKSVRTGTMGQVDDQYLDDTRWDKDKAPEAGRKSDANTGGGYADIALKDGKPEFMSKDAKPANAGGTYWLPSSDKVPFDDTKFKAGDEVASILVAPYAGDRGEISAASSWKGGKYTVEFTRKLVTGSKTDVQFDKLDATYYFGLAMFDNAQVRHAYNTGALNLQFAK